MGSTAHDDTARSPATLLTDARHGRATTDVREIRSYEKSLERSRVSLHRPDRPSEFTLLGRRWDLLDHVFAPPYSPSTRTAAGLLGLDSAAPSGTAAPLAPDAPAFLEVGSGAGVIAVQAALAGNRVSAVDVNEHAVRNTALNAARHGVADRLEAVHGDLLAPFAGRLFDRIFWSSNYVLAPEEYVFHTDHERAYVDPGYRAHRRYLTEAVHHLAPGGRALLHFCDRGQLDLLTRIAAEQGRALTTLAGRTVLEGESAVRHMLLEITAAE
ncbi:methyltransferase domain-containing protein [Streptomyces seoulensis]|uniref:methyltransferase domain-containing protein n=1 Tax=Streptomyces seoulensis TaxID=73044 RepID=UPI00099B9677|nr:methyltransferase domain-containing protein [Streptomyces seoulensis]